MLLIGSGTVLGLHSEINVSGFDGLQESEGSKMIVWWRNSTGLIIFKWPKSHRHHSCRWFGPLLVEMKTRTIPGSKASGFLGAFSLTPGHRRVSVLMRQPK